MRVVHVTEALGGGVASVLYALVNAQVEAGAKVEIVYTTRSTTPSADEVAEAVDSRVIMTRVETSRASTRQLVIRSWRALRSDDVTVVHAHSSWAGVLVRLLALGAGNAARRKVFYSPHGFAFLRLDQPTVARGAFLLAEAALGRVGTQILVSASESDVSGDRLHLPARRRAVLANAVAPSAVTARRRVPAVRPVVIMVGRVCFQKAPWIFDRAAAKLHDRADFVWVGDADKREARNWLGDHVRLTGWLSPSEVAHELAQADVMFFPTLWEGAPMALIEAQVGGLPAVASRIVGNVDIVSDGVTGLLATGEGALLDSLVGLLARPDEITRMSEACLASAPQRFSSDGLGHRSLDLYLTYSADY